MPYFAIGICLIIAAAGFWIMTKPRQYHEWRTRRRKALGLGIFMVNNFLKLRLLILLVLMCINFPKSHAQNFSTYKPVGQRIDKDSFGIRISSHQFDSLVQSLLIKFRSDSSQKSVEDYLQIVKVCNTIAYFNMEDKRTDCDELYSQLYIHKYLDKARDILGAEIGPGMSLYSQKYDMQMGGRKTKNNWYRIN
jgi:hypothetical protein